MHRGYLQLSSHPFVHLSSWASSQRGLQPIRAKEPSTDQPRKLVFGLGGDVHSEKTELMVLTTTLSHRLVLILHLERFPDQASAGNKFKVFLWSGPQILVDHIASFAFHLLLSSTDHRNADAAPLSHFVLLFFPKQDWNDPLSYPLKKQIIHLLEKKNFFHSIWECFFSFRLSAASGKHSLHGMKKTEMQTIKVYGKSDWGCLSSTLESNTVIKKMFWAGFPVKKVMLMLVVCSTQHARFQDVGAIMEKCRPRRILSLGLWRKRQKQNI